jgi:hypothetical protein
MLVKRGTGRWHDDGWLVEVELAVELPTGLRDLGRLELVYAREPAEAGPQVPVEVCGEAEAIVSVPPLDWRGFVYRRAQWRRTADGALAGRVRAAEPSDLWATPFVPEAALPGAQLESIFRAALSLQRAGEPVRRLSLARMERFGHEREWGAVLGTRLGDGWSVLDEASRTALRLDGLAYS